MQGYTVQFVQRVRSSDRSKIGVALGNDAVDKNIPIAAVAEYVGVTRVTVYSWFTGKFNPRGHNVELLKEFIANYVEPNNDQE